MNDFVSEENCAECGKQIRFFYYDKDAYIYKISRLGKTRYYCGFTCRNNALKKINEEREQKRRLAAEKRKRTLEEKRKDTKDRRI